MCFNFLPIFAAANILLTENGDVKVFLFSFFFYNSKIFYMRLCTNRFVNLFFTLYQVADFGVSAQLTRTISRRKVLTLSCQ